MSRVFVARASEFRHHVYLKVLAREPAAGLSAAPSRRWVADITYIPTAAGFLYHAAMPDRFSRRVIGWAMRVTLYITVVLDALETATTQRRATAVVHHSDHGSQQCVRVRTALPSARRAFLNGLSRRPVNTMAGNFFSTLECEGLAKHRLATHTEARLVLSRCIEGWYNPHRCHPALGQRSPLAFNLLHGVRSKVA